MNSNNLSLSQIADALGVTPSTLSQWQKRYKDDFPQHVAEIGRRRTYRLVDIQEFIARHDFPISKTNTRQPNPIRQSADILRSTNTTGLDSIIIIAFFACLWSHDRRILLEILKDGSDALKKGLRSCLHKGRQLVEQQELSESQIRTMAIIWLENIPMASDIERERVCNQLRSFFASSWDKSGSPCSTSKSLAKLIQKIGLGLEILDISTGVGTVLDEYQRGARTLVGQDINEDAVNLQQLFDIIQFGDPSRELVVSDSLESYQPRWKNSFDVVICDAPLNAKLKLESIQKDDERWKFLKQTSNQSQTDYWIQTVLAYLRVGRFRGIVVVHGGWLSNGGEQAMREALVSGGHIEAVIELGGGLASGTSIPVNLLIMRNTNPPVKQVRVIDASGLGELVRGRRNLSTDDIRQIVGALNSDTAEKMLSDNRDGSNSIFWKDISLGKLLHNDWILLPRRYLPVKKNEKDSSEMLNEIEVLIKEIKKTLSEFMKKLQLDDINRDVGFILNTKNPEVRSFKLGNPYDPDSPFIVVFKNRIVDTEWTTDDINYGDIVVCLIGTQIGECMRGNEFLKSGTAWTRVLLLRIRNSNFVDPFYVYAWLKFGGFRAQVERLSGGTLLKTINKKDINRIEIPIPSLEFQILLCSLVVRIDALSSTVKEVDELNQSLVSKTQGLLSSMVAALELDDSDGSSTDDDDDEI